MVDCAVTRLELAACEVDLGCNVFPARFGRRHVDGKFGLATALQPLFACVTDGLTSDVGVSASGRRTAAVLGISRDGLGPGTQVNLVDVLYNCVHFVYNYARDFSSAKYSNR